MEIPRCFICFVLGRALHFAQSPKFDIVLSLSGFNEATLHPVESPGDELWVGYPRGWDTRLTDTEDPEQNRLIWQGQVIQMKRRDLAIQAYRLRNIPLLSLHGAWSAIDSGYRNELHRAVMDLTRRRNVVSMRYPNIGPRIQYPSAESRRNAQCEMWCGGTRQLHRLCQSAGSKFLLCLQPNLFDRDGKPLTLEESEMVRSGSVYQPWVVQNFPHFALRGKQLRDEGISFFDLRSLYREVTDAVYRDDCCHFTKSGNDLLADKIASLIAAELN